LGFATLAIIAIVIKGGEIIRVKNNYWLQMEREFEKDLAMDKSFKNRWVAFQSIQLRPMCNGANQGRWKHIISGSIRVRKCIF
jgi:hypothetical protein